MQKYIELELLNGYRARVYSDLRVEVTRSVRIRCPRCGGDGGGKDMVCCQCWGTGVAVVKKFK